MPLSACASTRPSHAALRREPGWRQRHLHVHVEGRDHRLHQRPADRRQGPKARAALPRCIQEHRGAATPRHRRLPHRGVDGARLRQVQNPLPLVRAVVHAESNFDRFAVSSKGASGLMQLMPGTAREMYVRDIFDVKDNIDGGVRYLRVLANEFGGQMEKIIAAYNAGPEAVHRYDDNVPPYEETQAYVRKVLALYFKYKEQEQASAGSSSAGHSSWQ